MRILAICPGAGTSTTDVYNGHVDALKRAGHEVFVYSLNKRIDRAGQWLHWNYMKTKRQGIDAPKPTPADVLYWAGNWSIEMALRLRPDWIIVFSGMYFLKDTMRLLKLASYPYSKMAIVLSESPYDDAAQCQVVEWFDHVFTNEKRSVDVLKKFNPNVTYLPHAYDIERHRPDLPLEGDWPSHDVVFIGSGYQERIDLLSAIDWTGIDLGLYGSWTMVGSRSKLRQYIRKEGDSGLLHNRETVQLYLRSKIGINLHRTRVGFGRNNPTIAEGAAESLNPRAYELAACGVFQVSDYRPELWSVFGDAVPSFTDGEALSRVIRYHLARPDGMAAQAAEQRQRVALCTYDARVETLLGVLQGSASAAA